jgi:hypothetical protein
MRCQRAIIYYRDGTPQSYSLILDGTDRPGHPKGSIVRETAFKEAYELFPAIRKHWNFNGTAKD